MSDPLEDLRDQIVSALFFADGFEEMAAAAIAAYRSHPDGAAKDWIAGRDAAAEVIDFCTCPERENIDFCMEPVCLAGFGQKIRALQPPST